MNRDYYEMIGTTREAVEWDIVHKQSRTLKEQDKFIREKYEHAMKLLKIRKQKNLSSEKLQKLNKQEKEIIFAYSQVKSPILRDLYNQKLYEIENKKEEKRRNIEIPRKRSAYDILNTTRKALELRTDKQNDLRLEQKRNQLLARYSNMLILDTSFSDKKKIELAIAEINENYELIKTAEKREKYNEQLDKEEQEEIRKIKEQEIKNKYSHVSEYDLNLIDSGKEKFLKRKMVAKRDIQSSEIFSFQDKKNRSLKIRKIAEIVFRNCTRTYNSYINEYEITRMLDEEEKKDIVYTNLSMTDLSIDRKTGKPLNPDYYDCVVNRLLSEDVIAGSKYNDGYIGMVEKDKKGKYDITLGERKLNPTEQEMLTAVMFINKEKELKTQEREGESK